MIAFFDTSSVFKLYHEEQDSDAVRKAISWANDGIYLAEICRLEFRSALWRKRAEGTIDDQAVNSVVACFEKDYAEFNWIIVGSALLLSASALLMRYGRLGLRSLDSLQLAAACTLRDADCLYFTHDKVLRNLFQKEGFRLGC